MNDTGMPPLHDLQLERQVLGSCILHEEFLYSTELTTEDFYSGANQKIWTSIVGLAADGEPPDAVRLRARLSDTGMLGAIGGDDYLLGLTDTIPLKNLPVRRLRKLALQRRMQELARTVQLTASDLSSCGRHLDELDRVRAELAALESTPASKGSITDLVSLGSLMAPALARAEKRRSGEEKPIPIPFSKAYADALGGGLFPGAHYLVSGTGVGKSQLAIQTAINAAKMGIPTLYIGLELEEMQIALRVLGDQVGIRWSDLYLGRCSERELANARIAAASLEGLPFYCDFAAARGWPVSRLVKLCEHLRAKYPNGPLLIGLDYLQLVGDDAGEFERRSDTRERISAAATTARDVARRFDAAVLVISSAARTHYGLLASDAKDAGLVTQHVPGRFAPVRTILRPSVLLGLGKESGETEYSADSVTALIRWPTPFRSGETVIICATPKVRSVGERWCALAFDGGRFRELPDVQSVDDLPEIAKRGGKGQPVSDDELVTRVVATVRKGPGRYRSRSAIASATTGTKRDLLKAISRALESGELIESESGFVVRASEGGSR